MANANFNVSCSRIASFVKKDLKGSDFLITRLASMSNIKRNSITFSQKFDEKFLNRANKLSELFVVACSEYEGRLDCSYIISQNPRLDFLRIVREFFTQSDLKPTIHSTAIIENGAQIGRNVSIGANCYIGAGVIIGDGTKIHHNVVILGEVRIGKECVIKSGAIIGEEGFGFECGENGEPLHFTHVGAVVIENRVFIGSNSTIERATIDETKIGNNVKIDDHVQIGHNCTIHDNTMIAAGVILCGGVVIGKGCWIAPNVSIKQKLSIGDAGYIGLGSVVIRDVDAGTVVAGVPAKKIEKR